MSSRIRASSTWISPELVREILLWLPVKSLLRFRCVSKSWCTEIDSSDFVKAHLKKSNDSKIRLKLIVQHTNADPQFHPKLYAADIDQNLSQFIARNTPLNEAPSSITACNGLVLLRVRLDEFLLWNPFTRQYKKLPDIPNTNLYERRVPFGLGYDSASDDYKVVAIIYWPLIKRSQSWIYSLRLDSWRIIPDEAPLTRTETMESSIFCLVMKGNWADGALYWSYDLSGNFKIFGFDVAKEVFFELPSLPSHYQIQSFDGKLCSFRSFAMYKMQEFYMWESDNSEKNSAAKVAGCWTKAFEIDQGKYGNQLHFQFLCSEKGNGKRTLIRRKNIFFWYGLKGMDEEILGIEGLPEDCKIYDDTCNVCLESLVSLGNNSVYDGEEQLQTAPVKNWEKYEEWRKKVLRLRLELELLG